MSRLTGRTVLVVDDEPDLLEVTAEILELEGARTWRADGGFAALDILARERVDAVVSDVRMPGGTGLDLLEGLAAKTDPPPVTLVTGYSEFALEQAYHLGAQAVLAKPADFTAILDQVERMLIPRERRWTPAAPAPRATRTCAFGSLGEALAADRISLGSHGLFLPGADDLPVVGAALGLDGLGLTGVVRWVRPHQGGPLPAGFGFEVTAATPAALVEWLDLVKARAPRAYIPRR